MDPGDFTRRTVVARLEKLGDLFAPVLARDRSTLDPFKKTGSASD